MPDTTPAPDSSESQASTDDPVKTWTTAGVFVAVLLCVVIGIINPLDDRGAASRDDEDLVPLRGEIVVWDRTACADGAMLEIRADGNLEMPISYKPSPAPCRLNIDTEVPFADMYRFDIGDLPPMVIPYDRMAETDLAGRPMLTVDFSWYP